jgi:hypothetical protein
MIEVKEVTNTEIAPIQFDSEKQKLSDWVEAQPLERFTKCALRNGHGQMCGLGMIADYYGYNWDHYDWSLYEPSENPYSFIKDIFGGEYPISYDTFDRLAGISLETAKQYTIETLREQGL